MLPEQIASQNRSGSVRKPDDSNSAFTRFGGKRIGDDQIRIRDRPGKFQCMPGRSFRVIQMGKENDEIGQQTFIRNN